MFCQENKLRNLDSFSYFLLKCLFCLLSTMPSGPNTSNVDTDRLLSQYLSSLAEPEPAGDQDIVLSVWPDIVLLPGDGRQLTDRDRGVDREGTVIRLCTGWMIMMMIMIMMIMMLVRSPHYLGLGDALGLGPGGAGGGSVLSL